MVDSLKDQLVDNYKRKLEELLSWCESPIEQLMLLHLINYFEKQRTGGFRDFSDWAFLEDEILLYDPELSYAENKRLEERAKKHSYRLNHIFYEKVYGINVKMYSEGIDGDDFKSGNIVLIGRELEIYPQKEVEVSGERFRIDIAFILRRKQYKDLKDLFVDWNYEIVESKKVAIECDGHAFHNTPQQIERDNQRSRKLETQGWHVLRYSGRELNRLESTDQFHGLFTEVINILCKVTVTF